MVNGSDRQSMVSGLTSPVSAGGANARDSVMSELESPTTPKRVGAVGGWGRSPPTTIKEQPFELGGGEEG